ncbi:MAG: YebC/PmpR family DNA-binding transcriptional regulator [Deltaproteobacteria bacterium CG11_big_fil_rev_8_21_14_0_20_45_16]|nr:MAG: YebC/PmpR family DNA-binding transcriptional regulator [Deltaproteobacteria bacterium CG11_big_fil_rev_8_21_14_0_20_45_16]
MAGHNKWSKVKRLKAVTDKKKSALYAKYIKEITVAAKEGGPDPDGNSRLKKAIADAKAQSVPRDNIERALKRAAGESDDGAALEELVYEGYGPGGVAILMECITDKRARTQPELKKILERAGGSMAEVGAVSWGFDRKGSILVSRAVGNEERMMELCLELGAEDFSASEEGYEITTAPNDFLGIVEGLGRSDVPIEFSEIGYIPKNRMKLSGDLEDAINRLVESLEEHDDVQRVTTNAEAS